MALIKIVSAKEFINNISMGKLSESQLNRALAYIRAKRIAFYDTWSKEHCLLQDELLTNKVVIIEALKQANKLINL